MASPYILIYQRIMYEGRVLSFLICNIKMHILNTFLRILFTQGFKNTNNLYKMNYIWLEIWYLSISWNWAKIKIDLQKKNRENLDYFKHFYRKHFKLKLKNKINIIIYVIQYRKPSLKKLIWHLLCMNFMPAEWGQ